jgi:tetratricopeptide (TPR) repeat protein
MKVLNNIIKVLILAVATICHFSGYANGGAAEAQAEWQRGLEAYAAKNYAEAKEAFESIDSMGYASADLYYNLGNTYFKLGQQHERAYDGGELGRAILNYRRALKCDPAMEDASYNLDLAQDFTNDAEPLPVGVVSSMWSGLRGFMTSNGWVVLSIISLVAALSLVMLYLLSDKIIIRKSAFFVAIALVFVFILTTSLAVAQRTAYESSSEAVIVCNNIISVHASPDNTSKVIRQPSQGVSVYIIRTHGDWTEIEFVDGEKGWIPSKSVERV